MADLILVVDDNDKSPKLVRDVLMAMGYAVIEANTGEEGVRLAHERLPNLILMDIRLPGIDGPCSRSGRTTRHGAFRSSPSAYPPMGQSRRRVMAAGFDAYQAKPLNVKAPYGDRGGGAHAMNCCVLSPWGVPRDGIPA
jgi:two-component system cell cycle response regulator DivK